VSRILIVDDHSPSRSLIRAIVTLDGHSVVEASTAAEAVESLAKVPFDLMLLDLVMPEPDGYHVLEQLRAMPGRADTPVITLSDREDEIDAMRAVSLGALDHIAKPFGYDEMEKSIKRVLEATPEQIIELREAKAAQVATYNQVIELVDDAKEPARRGFFRRARAARR
jgi:DNA-binding response OmpR family regulator